MESIYVDGMKLVDGVLVERWVASTELVGTEVSIEIEEVARAIKALIFLCC